jgi:hypothetical protein
MRINVKDLYGIKLSASDGDLGHIQDFYIDDKSWIVRYLVADTGSWLAGRMVLLSPFCFGNLDQEKRHMKVALTKKQIEDSPPIESHLPISRQYETDYYNYYSWPAYWYGGGIWGNGDFPILVPPTEIAVEAKRQQSLKFDAHLRSTRAINGYKIQTADGTIGHVCGFMVNNKSWAVRELVVETGHWFSGKEILISTDKVERIGYEDSKVFVTLSKAEIQRSCDGELAEAGAPGTSAN